MSRRLSWLLSMLGALCACNPTLTDTAPQFDYPLDDVLRFQDLQAKGTHNSYHTQAGDSMVPEWNYSHASLDLQLSLQGVRQFELDLWYNVTEQRFDVYHVPLLDQSSSCETLLDCLQVLKSWSDDNRGHHPLFVLIEPKTGAEDAEGAQLYLQRLETELLSVWPEQRLVTPDLVRGEADSLLTAVQEQGWPTLGELRGRALFVLHTGGLLRSEYTYGDAHASGRLMFPDASGDGSLPYAAVHTMNDPFGSFDAISELVGQGHLVRTRGDADLQEAESNDLTRQQAAMNSGAHFISTDFPVPVQGTDYVVNIPGGSPSRCNPVRAPEVCTSLAIEDPDQL